ncbi:SCP1.201-like deaminase [Prauserella aidingensis]|uniref:DddA-like double-stranded DNA deaminase toxin n=1 Tax=Prauserella aidingensis TaxID=387890 RepID=UPI0020A5623E|nr:DddA-like double-stranded DNA deaminase toxin [Prauserella aidingensis]MCP2252376.1 SCP1.201-like deaminase [Prauserella aidingensis]
MSVEQLAEAIGRVLDQIASARAALAHASHSTVEVRDMYAYCLGGAHDPDAAQAPGAAAEAAEQADQQHGRLAHIEQTMRGYLDQLGATVAPPAARGSAAPTPARQDDAPRATTTPGDRVARERAELPPRVGTNDRVQQKPHGRWWTSSSDEVGAMVSGRDDTSQRVQDRLDELGIPRRPVARASDVEMKLAAHMADRGITDATVVINHRPCVGLLGCDTLVPILLPSGSKLTVHGVESDGTPFAKTYEGGAKPWWH